MLKMETLEHDILTRRDEKFLWKPFFRQVFVCSGAWASDFVFGLSFGAPAVLIPQVRQEANSTAAISEDMASWLSSASGVSGIFWVLVLPYIATMYGRRISFLIVTLNSIIGNIVFYCSSTVLQIIVAEAMLGAARSCINTVSPMIVAEYTSPQYRGLFLTIEAVCVFWGIWVANATGTFSHWKNIGIIGIVFSVYTSTALFWPESPHWLAAKGRVEKCTSAYRWLHSSSNKSKAELEFLIAGNKVENSGNVITESNKNNLAVKRLTEVVAASNTKEWTRITSAVELLLLVKDQEKYAELTAKLL
ncbi:arabinose-proton symporter-like isoform X2 [Choristoneura fumiferana]|uniref:arabinose-proton symporter-like isoform X2 n=1 Tax=Choristoneura fumiferana TaxID=7141 RepID=UPI003D158842